MGALLRAGVARAKLRVAPANDSLKRTADRTADMVMRSIKGGSKASAPRSSGGTCLESAAKAGDLRRSTPDAAAGRMDLSDASEAVARDMGPGRPIDRETRFEFESHFGRDLSDVRIHDGPAANRAAESVSARAFTLGNSIAFSAGEFAPNTDQGRWLIAHELAHIAGDDGFRADADTRSSDVSGGVGLDAVVAGASRAIGGTSSTFLAERTGESLIQRAYIEEPSAGCGVCLPPNAAGDLAHDLIQAELETTLGISSEATISSPTDRDTASLTSFA